MHRQSISTMKTITHPLIILLVLFASCVPARRYQELKTDAQICADEKRALTSENERLRSDLEDMRVEVDRLNEAVDILVKDTTMTGTTLRRLTKQYDKINELNDQLMRKQASLMSSSESEKKALLENLMELQQDLQEQQARLAVVEKDLNEKSLTLEDREARVAELEALLSKQEEVLNSLKDRVSAALLGFKGKGLSIVEKDGRVYVSLEAKLLFASGSTVVSSEGTEALEQLAKAIQDDTDLSILVEGHTDTDKIIGNSLPFKDNWDLSVMRATSVVRILLTDSRLDPTRVTAAGRSEYLPVDISDKAKNRRIEIILEPDLTELFQLINEG